MAQTICQNKLEPRSKPCVYLGLSQTHRSHQCFDPISSKIFMCRDVVFVEDQFRFVNIFSHLKDKIFGVSMGSDSSSTYKLLLRSVNLSHLIRNTPTHCDVRYFHKADSTSIVIDVPTSRSAHTRYVALPDLFPFSNFY